MALGLPMFTSLISTKSHCFRNLPDLLRIPDVRCAEKLGVSSADLALRKKVCFSRQKTYVLGERWNISFRLPKQSFRLGKGLFPKGKTNVCRKGWRTIGKPKFQTRVSSLRNNCFQAGRKAFVCFRPVPPAAEQTFAGVPQVWRGQSHMSSLCRLEMRWRRRRTRTTTTTSSTTTTTTTMNVARLSKCGKLVGEAEQK